MHVWRAKFDIRMPCFIYLYSHIASIDLTDFLQTAPYNVVE